MAEQRTSTKITEPRVMRALAHPARIAILEHLDSTGGVATATQCAELVGLSPSATSYHLRELAKVGLVEQAPSRGDGRERVWRSTSAGLSVDGDTAEPETRAAEQALVEVWTARNTAQVQQWWARRHGEPKEWQEAATLMVPILLLTAEELVELNAKVTALVEPYRRRNRIGKAPEGARPVTLQYAAVPRDEAERGEQGSDEPGRAELPS
ncbi:helix-turn-helix transcriptional regulator [Actinoplanes sp. TFC3]|uniref:ArsR/SmtB family transcription factor n=1 Tax=Actinoplanes sp. TFC3 TaxID=1710355 RepID=UPI00082B7A68|nr:metalloregulator ArsR/SmtB family transcription factor [Actinoplanes sp. TFC3]